MKKLLNAKEKYRTECSKLVTEMKTIEVDQYQMRASLTGQNRMIGNITGHAKNPSSAVLHDSNNARSMTVLEMAK